MGNVIDDMRATLNAAEEMHADGRIDDLYALAVVTTGEVAAYRAQAERYRTEVLAAEKDGDAAKARADGLRRELAAQREVADHAATVADEAVAESERAEKVVEEIRVVLRRVEGDYADDVALRVSERDEARRECRVLHAETDRLRAMPRIGHPTRAEWDAHRATGGEWICVHRITGDWDCGVAMLHSERADLWHIPVRDNAPCAWPVVAAEGGV